MQVLPIGQHAWQNLSAVQLAERLANVGRVFAVYQREADGLRTPAELVVGQRVDKRRVRVDAERLHGALVDADGPSPERLLLTAQLVAESKSVNTLGAQLLQTSVQEYAVGAVFGVRRVSESKDGESRRISCFSSCSQCQAESFELELLT